MKRVIAVTIIIACLLCLISCGGNESLDVLAGVLDNNAMFIAENGDATYLKDYKVAGGELPVDSVPAKYVYVDMDGDKNDELVIEFSDTYGHYLVLHYNGQEVYGFEFNLRALLSLKTDGSFMGSNGAASHSYNKLSFGKDRYVIINEAIKDDMQGIYELGGKAASIVAVDEFIDNWNKKTDVEWKSFE